MPHPPAALANEPGQSDSIRNSQAWRLAGLIQDRLTYQKDERAIAIPGVQHKTETPHRQQAQDEQTPPPPAPGLSQASGAPNADPLAASKNWDGAIYTYIVSTGDNDTQPPYGTMQLRVGRTRTAERGGKSWIELSYDGGKIFREVAWVPRTQEKIDGKKEAASVEHPYIYTVREGDQLKIVFGTCAADPESKRWDTFERDITIPLTDIANHSAWETALKKLTDENRKPELVLKGNEEYAYKDGVPIPDENGIYGKYLAVTVHEIGNGDPDYAPALAVNAHTELFKRGSDGKYHHEKPLLERNTDDQDKTCSRYTGRIQLLDSICVFRDVRNNIEPNAAFHHRQIGFRWPINTGDFDELASVAICLKKQGILSEIDGDLTPVSAVLGRSPYDMFPTLRYLDITPLIHPQAFADLTQKAKDTEGLAEDMARKTLNNYYKNNNPDDNVVSITYEKAGENGSKCTYQQFISRHDLMEALAGRGPGLLVGQDPGPSQTNLEVRESKSPATTVASRA